MPPETKSAPPVPPPAKAPVSAHRGVQAEVHMALLKVCSSTALLSDVFLLYAVLARWPVNVLLCVCTTAAALVGGPRARGLKALRLRIPLGSVRSDPQPRVSHSRPLASDRECSALNFHGSIPSVRVLRVWMRCAPRSTRASCQAPVTRPSRPNFLPPEVPSHPPPGVPGVRTPDAGVRRHCEFLFRVGLHNHTSDMS